MQFPMKSALLKIIRSFGDFTIEHNYDKMLFSNEMFNLIPENEKQEILKFYFMDFIQIFNQFFINIPNFDIICEIVSNIKLVLIKKDELIIKEQ